MDDIKTADEFIKWVAERYDSGTKWQLNHQTGYRDDKTAVENLYPFTNWSVQSYGLDEGKVFDREVTVAGADDPYLDEGDHYAEKVAYERVRWEKWALVAQRKAYSSSWSSRTRVGIPADIGRALHRVWKTGQYRDYVGFVAAKTLISRLEKAGYKVNGYKSAVQQVKVEREAVERKKQDEADARNRERVYRRVFDLVHQQHFTDFTAADLCGMIEEAAGVMTEHNSYSYEATDEEIAHMEAKFGKGSQDENVI